MEMPKAIMSRALASIELFGEHQGWLLMARRLVCSKLERVMVEGAKQIVACISEIRGTFDIP